MGKLTVLFVLGLAILPPPFFYGVLRDEPAPELPNYFWGPKSKEGLKEDTSIRPFKINIDEKVLTDLKTRLKLETSVEGNRLTPPLEEIGFQYGFNTDFLKSVTQHWLNKYDWRAREKELNKYPQFKTTIAGIEIHFQHVKSNGQKKYKTTRPLLLLHGWPGSFVEFQKVIPMLTDPKDSDINFELIIPSLPGYGFSERSHKTGLGTAQTGQIFLKLMKRLGHEIFYVQGGDWGAFIATDMSALYPKNVVAVHMNMCTSAHSRTNVRILLASFYPTLFMDQIEADKSYPMSKFWSNILEETGYMHIQSTKPDTVGVALSHSPSGLAAYILEKFSTWTNLKWKAEKNGGLVPYYDLDNLLDNVMVYWVSGSIVSSMRLYSEAFSKARMDLKLDNVPVKVPTGCLASPHEFFAGQSEWLLQDKFPQLLHFTHGEKGGHFSAFEVPDVFAKDVVKFFSDIEKSGAASFAKSK
jgi:juvenile hormone epoxide hydrolase